MPGYLVYRFDRKSRTASGGAAILIKRQIKHHQVYLPVLEKLEAVSVKLIFPMTSVQLIAAYQPPRYKLSFIDFRNLFSSSQPILLLGDLNSKHLTWGCRVNNPNGTRLLSISTESSFLVNAPSEPTYYSYRPNCAPDILDIALVKNLSISFSSNVLPELTSDHLPVIYDFSLNPQIYDHLPRLIEGPVDWDEFRLILDSYLLPSRHLYSSTSIDLTLAHYEDAIKKAVKEATIKKYSLRLTTEKIPASIQSLIDEKNNVRRYWLRLRKTYGRHINMARFGYIKRRLNQLTRRVKYDLDKNRYQNYEHYLSNLTPEDCSLWKATKRLLKKPSLIPPLVTDSSIFQSDEEKAAVFSNMRNKI